MNCDEKQRLLKAYETAATRFSEAVTDWHQKVGVSAQDDYQELRRIAEQARLDSERARGELEAHAKSHGC